MVMKSATNNYRNDNEREDLDRNNIHVSGTDHENRNVIPTKNVSHRTTTSSTTNESCDLFSSTKTLQQPKSQLEYGNNNKNDNNEDIDTNVVAHSPLPQYSSTTITTTVATKSHIIHPPISIIERYRDRILRTLDAIVFQYIGVFVLLGIVIDGALFFFLLVGLHTLCTEPHRTNCEPRNTVYNISIQVLNVFFTYMAIISLPWRISNFIHLQRSPSSHRNDSTKAFCCNCCSDCRYYPRRCNDVGHNLYGQYDIDIWFHIPLRRRYYITVLLLCNCVFQFMNQGTRIIFFSYELQASYPGTLWTNLFFVSAFVCAGMAALWILYESHQLRKLYPNKFGHGPINTIKHYHHHHFLPWYQQQYHTKYICYCCRSSNVIRRKRKSSTIMIINQTTHDIGNAQKEVENDVKDEQVAMDFELNPKEVQLSLSQHHPVEVIVPNNNNNGQDTYSSMMTMDNIPDDANVYDPTRAVHHPHALAIEDRGALRMFGL